MQAPQVIFASLSWHRINFQLKTQQNRIYCTKKHKKKVNSWFFDTRMKKLTPALWWCMWQMTSIATTSKNLIRRWICMRMLRVLSGVRIGVNQTLWSRDALCKISIELTWISCFIFNCNILINHVVHQKLESTLRCEKLSESVKAFRKLGSSVDFVLHVLQAARYATLHLWYSYHSTQ